ncbi:MAG: hypothetical protein AB7V08_13980 [Elusimicrobiales bacterium]
MAYRFSDPDLEREYRAIRIPTPKGPDMPHPKQKFRINFTFSQPTDSRGGRMNRSESVNLEAENSTEAQRQFRADFEDEYPGCELRSVTCIPVGG